MKQILNIVLLFSISALVVVGCTKKSDETSILYLANGAEPESLDPIRVESLFASETFRALFEGLTTGDPVTAKGIPGVAESWDVADNAQTFTFHIRKDAKFSDGVQITAQTVYDSWLMELAPETAAPYAYLPGLFIQGAQNFTAGTGSIDDLGMEVVDKYTFRVRLNNPTPYFPTVIAHPAFPIVPIHVIEKYGDGWTKPENFVGNGPYVLTEWIPQDHIRVKKSPTYWDRDTVQVEELVYYATPDQNTAFNMYENGEVDVLLQSPVPADLLDSVRNRPDYHVAPQYATYYYALNNTIPVLNDVRVRQALSKGVNRTQLVEGVTKGGQVPTYSFVPPMDGYDPLIPYDSVDISQDIAEAQQLLAEAGYPGGKGFPKFTVIYNTQELHKKVAEFMQEQWKQNLGIDVVLANYEWKTFLQVRQSGDFEIARSGWYGDYLDPSTFTDLVTETSNYNDGRYYSKRYNDLVQMAAMAAEKDRFPLFRQAEQVLLDDAGVIPLYYFIVEKMYDPEKVGGLTLNVLQRNNPKYFRKLK